MQNECLAMNIAQPNSRAHLSYSVRVAAARRFRDCLLLLRVFNVELTVLSARLTPPINI